MADRDFLQLAGDFSDHIRFERRLSPHTTQAYVNDLRQFLKFLGSHYEIDRPEAVEGFHIRSWLAELKAQGLQNRSLRRKVAALNTFFLYLIRCGVTAGNPVQQVLLPKLNKPLPEYLEPGQMQTLQSAGSFPPDFEGFTQRLIIELLYQTGMRRSELLGLKETDVNNARSELRVLGKGNKIRILPLHSELLTELNAYMKLKKKIFEKPGEYLLSLKSGKQLYPRYVYRTVTNYLNQVTTLNKTNPHLLRHTFASHLLNNGAELLAIKELLGHSSLAATQVYTHLNIDKLKEIYRKAHPKS